MHLRRITTIVLSSFAAVALVPAAASAAAANPVTLKIVKSRTVNVVGFADTYFAFADGASVDKDDCGVGFVPIAVGWKNRNVPSSGPAWYVDPRKPMTTSFGYKLSVARPLATGSTQAHTVCAKGPVLALRKEAKLGTVVSCGTKTALGYLNLVNVKQESAVSSVPVGRTGWRETAQESEYSTSSAVCVDKAAFTSVARVTTTAKFAVGSRTATVVATCARGSRAIGWGFSAPLMLANQWVGDGKIQSPFVESAVPGAASWSITFSTPNLAGAVEATPVTAWAVCGKPRVR